jgi:hypothetical protein
VAEQLLASQEGLISVFSPDAVQSRYSYSLLNKINTNRSGTDWTAASGMLAVPAGALRVASGSCVREPPLVPRAVCVGCTRTASRKRRAGHTRSVNATVTAHRVPRGDVVTDVSEECTAAIFRVELTS